MAGTSYTRQSTFIDGDTITAALFNDEYNQLVNAFSYASSGTTGHQHDGTAGEGGNIHTIGDQDFLNKIVVDSTNNRWGVYVEVGGVATEQIRIQDGAIVPVTDNDIDLGTSSLEFKDLYLDGTANIDSLVADTVDINAGTIDGTTIGATSASTGAFTTLTASGDTTLSGALSVEGNTILGNAATDTVTFTADVSSNILPSADSTYDLGDGSTYWANAYIDAVTTTGNVAIGGNLTVTGNATIAGNLTFGDAATDTVAFSADVASNLLPSADGTYSLGAVGSEWQDLYIDGTANIDSLVADTADINGGTIDSTAIGSTTASTGNFSTLSINGTAITSTAAELNLLDGVTATTIEINYLDGVTSNIQTQLDALQDSDADLTAIAALTPSDGNFIVGNGTTWVAESGNTVIASLGVTATAAELNYTDGVTSNIQTQLDTKAPLASPTFTGTVTADGLSLGDNEKATFGASNDLEIYHDGSHSRIDDTGTGNLIIRANAATSIQKYTGEIIGQFTADGSVDLYYDNAVKFATTSTGIDVTGTVTADGLVAKDSNLTIIDTSYNAQAIIQVNDNGVLTLNADSNNIRSGTAIRFYVDNSEAMRIDSAGNVGIGVSALETTSSTRSALTIDNSFFAWGRDSYNEAGVAQGSYRNSAGNDEYRTTGVAASQVAFSAGTINLQVAASGTNGNTISWTDGLVVDNSGNVGIGATPSAWLSQASTLQLGGRVSLGAVGSNDDLHLTSNAYYNGTDWKAQETATASNYYMTAGTHVWRYAASTTAGATVSWSEAMRIGSSGDLLVAKTVSDTSTPGVRISGTSAGFVALVRDSGRPLYIRRNTTDGDIIEFAKDGTTVGSIGSEGGDSLYIGNGDVGLKFSGGADAIPAFNPSTGAVRDGAIDFGTSGARFKDLHLSGTANVANISETVYALTGTALDPANGGIQTKTLAANTTFTDSLSSGESLVLQLEAGASYTVTWPTITWVTSSGNTAPTLTAKDTLVFWKVSTTLYGAYTGSYV